MAQRFGVTAICLPAYQGARFRSSGPPILDLERPADLSRERQRREFDLLKWLNTRHGEQQTDASDLEARINAYELAFRMQTAAPEVVDLASESEATKKLYGLDDPNTAGFGRQCLLARQLVEQGVRYTLLIHGERIASSSWDDHSDTKGRMPQHAAEVDKPVSALADGLEELRLTRRDSRRGGFRDGPHALHPARRQARPQAGP